MIKLCTTNSMTKDNKINPRYISLFYAVTNCALGCAIGFYYGDVTFRTIVVVFSLYVITLLITLEHTESIDLINRKGL